MNQNESVIVYTNNEGIKPAVEEAIKNWAAGYEEAIDVEFGAISIDAESGDFAIDVTEGIFGLYDEIHAVVAAVINPPEEDKADEFAGFLSDAHRHETQKIIDESLTVEFDDLSDDADDFRDYSLSMNAEF